MTSDTGNFHSRATNVEADALEKRKERQERQTALIFAVLIAVLSGTGIILVAKSNPPSGPSSIEDCASIKPGNARLSCYDVLSRQAAPAPFKGAPPSELAGSRPGPG